MGRRLHNLLTTLLSCTVLLAALLPPAVSHVHAVGDQPHSHEAAEQNQHSHSHSHGHGHHHENGHPAHHASTDDHETPSDRDDEGAAATLASTAHIHVTIAGLNFSLPLPSDSGSNTPLMPVDDHGDGNGVFRLTSDTVTVPRVDLSSAIDVSVASPMLVDSVAGLMNAAAQWMQWRATDRVCLCDSARCERSGVLLI